MGFQQTWMPGRKRLRHRGTCFRLIRTTQERRAWDDEFGRFARSRHRLVDAWDEVIRWPVRTWKVYRRVQYKT